MLLLAAWLLLVLLLAACCCLSLPLLLLICCLSLFCTPPMIIADFFHCRLGIGNLISSLVAGLFGETLVSCCWLGAAYCLAAAGLLLPACCCCLAAAGGMLLVTFCCCWVVGVVLLLVGCLLPLPLPALQSLLICCWLLLHKPYHCGSVVNWAWKAWFWLRWPVW